MKVDMEDPVRCPIDNAITAVMAGYYSEPRQVPFSICGVQITQPRLLGWGLECGHVIDPTIHELRFMVERDRATVRWFVERGSSDVLAPPDDAIRVLLTR